MKKRFIKFFVALSTAITCLTGCSIFSPNHDNGGGNVPQQSDSGDVSHQPGGGEIITEDKLDEQLVYEDLLTEDRISEYTLEAQTIIESIIPEDYIVESLEVESLLLTESFIDQYMEGYHSGAIHQYDIDWPSVIGQFAVGTAVILITGTLAAATASIPGVGFVFMSSFKGALKESLIGGLIGAALNTGINGLTNEFTPDSIKKYAIEGASEGFMWGAISGAIMGAFSGLRCQYSHKTVMDGNKVLGKVNEAGELVDGKKVVGCITQNNYVVDNAGKVLGSLDKHGNLVAAAKNLIPKNGVIYTAKSAAKATGKKVVKYTIKNTNQVFSKGKLVGIINEAGGIIDDAGHLVGQIDDYGRLVGGIDKAVKAGMKFNVSGKVINATQKLHGITQYLDDAGKPIAQLMKCKNSKGNQIQYITKIVDLNDVKYFGDPKADFLSKIVGQADDAGNLLGNWDKIFSAERSAGVRKAWKAEADLVKATGKGTRAWTKAEIKELLKTGVVKGYQGHHINSALYSPALAAEPNNIFFYSAAEHLKLGHHGNFSYVTFGELVSRIF